MPWASIAGSVISGMMSGDSAGDASGAQSQATEAATAEARRQYNLNRADMQPWQKTGSKAVTRLGEMLGLGEGTTNANAYTGPIDYNDPEFLAIRNPILQKYALQYGGGNFAGVPAELRNEAYGEEEAAYRKFMAEKSGSPSTPVEGFGSLNKKFTLADFWDDPVTKASYQFGLDEGTKALGNMAGAKGNRNSGAQMKALTKFATDYTGTKSGESYNRFYGDQDRTFNRLAGVSGTGQTAAINTAQMGTNMSNTVGGLMAAQGNARGAAAIAQGNAMGGIAGNIGNSISNWWNRNSQPTPFNPGSSYNSGGSFQPYYSMSSDNYG